MGLRATCAIASSPKLRGPGRLILGRSTRHEINGDLQRGQDLQIADHAYVFVHSSGSLKLGENVYIGRGAILTCFNNVEIGSNVRIAERVSIHDENHAYEPAPVADRSLYTTKPVAIGSGVWIGANSVILPGTVIGDDSVVGAGSVVRGTFPARSLIAGVPARVVREIAKA
ncbi:acyltransferase [Microbacterium testaceum]|uniref:acyltransferase n=1 Tax=Microbacterium testaceum TaxID=2033 RepID=UPI0023AA1C33|nr:acyltransferase [Microbacterium testaceum]